MLRGCKEVEFTLDERSLCNHRVILRQGPGCDGVRFGQTIIFSEVDKSAMFISSGLSLGRGAGGKLISTPAIVKQDYETQRPTGLTWTLHILENWNDQYYCGLDKFEFYDAKGHIVDVVGCGGQISAVPFSVEDISVSGDLDPRSPEKLFTISEGKEGDGAGNCWLCPLAACMTTKERSVCAKRIAKTNDTDGFEFSFPRNNVVVIQFPFPISISAIRYVGCIGVQNE